MYHFLIYMIKAALSLAALYLCFKLLCSRDALYRFNRRLILLIFVLSAEIPCIYIDLGVERHESSVIVEELVMSMETMPSTIAANEPTPTFWEQIPWSDILVGLYLIGVAVCMMRFVLSLISIVRLIKNSERRKMSDGTILVSHNDTYSPFSWMRYIIVSIDDLRENRDMILAHERAHIHLHHSWDLLFAQLCVTVQWFNPTAWLLKRELETIHEYEADSYILRQGFDERQYQLCLFEAATGVKFNTITNNFNNCSTKNRITMMKRKTSPWARMKALFVLPVAFAAVVVISCTSPKEKSYPIRIGKNDVKEYSISDFGKHPAVMITYEHSNEAIRKRSQTVTMQGNYSSHGLEAFLNGGDERREFLAGCNVTEADIDSVRIFFPGETDLCGNIGDNGVLVIYLNRYIKGLQSYKENKRLLASNIQIGDEGGNTPLLVIVLSDDTEIFTIQNEGIEIFNENNNAFLAHFNLNEQDIDEISVLQPGEAKDAYGDHGANGVVKLHVKHKSKQDIIEALRKLTSNETPIRVQIKVPSDIQAGIDEVQAVGYNSASKSEEQGEVFQVVEGQPEFPGGIKALMEYLKENVKYPQTAQDRGVQGRVIVGFIVEKDGSIIDAYVMKSIDPQLDGEALRVVRNMPKWEPGTMHGKPVRVRYSIPVVFRLFDEGTTKQEVEDKIEISDNEIFQVVEEMPEFPGGMDELMKFMQKNIKYPKEAQDRGIQGRVIVQFVINTDGSICNEVIVKSVDPQLDAEAIRLLRSMPNWKPGKQRGKNVRVKFTLPVAFKLN